jgi:hypothetical protein
MPNRHSEEGLARGARPCPRRGRAWAGSAAPLALVGFFLGLVLGSEVGWPKFLYLFGLLSMPCMFCYGLNVVLLFFFSFHLFWPICDVFPYITCKTSELTKIMEIISFKVLFILFLVNSIRMLAG